MIELIHTPSEKYYHSPQEDEQCQFEEFQSYEEYIRQGHTWCWCLVGNIAEKHEYGEEHETKYGTKQFSRGTKVYLAPSQWGDGYENIVVIGMPRHKRNFIEVITRSAYIENYRMQKVYQPAVLKRMCNSEYRWWGDNDRSRNEIISYLESRNPEEADKQKLLWQQNQIPNKQCK